MTLPRRFCPFLTIALLSTSLTLPPTQALPASPPPPPAPITNLTSPPLTLLIPGTTCIPKRNIFTRCPSYYDCAQAIFELPSLSGQGSFHNGAPDDVFKLPVWKTHESCRVRVELIHEGGGRQSGSWHVVVARALGVAETCINTPMRERENSGGWTLLGKQKRLLIFLEHSGGIGYGNDVGVGVGLGVGGIGDGNGNGNDNNKNVTVL